ncbi:MAG: hypothetical protein FLDDKLPJ_00137 [Phycisphaerae bacterium]|nr:hypothetical protein [Phycisphaerae bacterium]
MPGGWLQKLATAPLLGSAAATVQAWRVARRRYGRVYEALVPEIERRSRMSRDEMRAHCDERLAVLLGHAYAHVPHYREAWRRAGILPQDLRAIDDLARRLPLLSREEARAAPQRLLDERLAPSALVRLSTSGSTGSPLTLFRTPEAEATSYAFFEARCRRPAGMQFGRLPYVMIGGQLVAPVTRDRPPFWVYNYAWKQLYLSSYHLSERFLPHYVKALRRRPYHAILGYPSSLHTVARHLLERGEPPIPMRCAITSSETLLEHQREAIERAFGCKVFDQYGAGELCVFAAQCGRGSMHVSPDYGRIEVIGDDGRPCRPGETGELVCTSLINFGQVFIRYRIGDRGAIDEGRCACGSALPVLSRLEGRVDEVLRTRDGRAIGRLDPVFKGVEHVREAQIVQEEADRFVVRVVPAPGYDAGSAELIRRNLSDRVGDVRIDVVTVEAIERTRAGKFRAVISRVNPPRNP